MRDPHGYAEIIDPEGRQLVSGFDVVSCIHCPHVQMVKSGMTGRLEVMVYRADGTHYFKEAGFCRNCMGPVCPRCDGKPCSNRFRRLEQEEKAARQFICT